MAERYRCILADPPWPHHGGGNRGAQEHYPLLEVQHIAPIMTNTPEWRPYPDCHLWLWVPNNWLPAGLRVMAELNFRYVTNLVWVKDKIGLGHYLRGKHELLL
jgi:N6-adenosine-specific RNA methylase IME4